MSRDSKGIRRALRQLAHRAYELELAGELAKLGSEFDRWQRGEISPFDVSEAIHRFHQGPARDLYAAYTGRHPRAAVAHAIHAGILDRAQIASDMLKELAGALDMYESGRPAE